MNDVKTLNLKAIAAFDRANRTCFADHPGLCIADSAYSSILAFHKAISEAVKALTTKKDEDGAVLVLFAGYRRLRDAEAAGRREDAQCVRADTFDLAMLSDQPERRRGWRTWTRCRFAEGRQFEFGQHVGLVNTARQTLEEHWSYAWAKRLRDKAKYHWVHFLAFADIEDELPVMKVLGVSRRAPCYKSADVTSDHEMDIGEAFEAAIDKSLEKPATPASARESDVDPFGIDAAFDLALGVDGDNEDIFQEESSLESVAASNASSDLEPSEDSREGADAISDDGADLSGAVTQDSEHFERRGNRLYRRGKHVGSLTSCAPCTCFPVSRTGSGGRVNILSSSVYW